MPFSFWPRRKSKGERGDPHITAPYADPLNLLPERSKSINDLEIQHAARGNIHDPRASWHEGAAPGPSQNYYNRLGVELFSHAPLQNSRRNTNRMIDKQINLERRNISSEFHRILILGSGNSGKSTLSKQLNIIYNQCFTKDAQCAAYTHRIIEVLYELCVDACHLIIQAPSATVPPDLREYAKELLLETWSNDRSASIAKKMKKLWKHNCFLEYIKQFRRELQYEELYFIHEWRRVLKKQFIPQQVDVIHCHDKSGTIETDLFFGKLDLRLTDIGDKFYSPRLLKKMDNVSTIIFCVPLDEWDTQCDAPRTQSRSNSFCGTDANLPPVLDANRPKTISRELNSLDTFNFVSHIEPETKMFYALEQFRDICTDWFPGVSILLYFTKEDLFRERIGSINKRAGTEVYDADKLIRNFVRRFEETFTDSIQLGTKKLLHVHILTTINPVEVAQKFDFQEVKEFLVLDWQQKKAKNTSNLAPPNNPLNRRFSFAET